MIVDPLLPPDPTHQIAELADVLAPADADLVRRAYFVAEHAHRGQLRKHGEHFVTHPVTVARLAHDLFGVNDGRVLAAALLHDVVEDTPLELDDLTEFPARTLELVDLLTDPEGPMTPTVRRDHYEHIWADHEATLVKACDRLSNLDDARRQPRPDFCTRYALRTEAEMMQPGMPLSEHPVAAPLLRAAIGRCAAAGQLPPAGSARSLARSGS